VGQVDESKSFGNRRVTRNRGKTYEVQVKKTTTVLMIKLEVSDRDPLSISRSCQICNITGNSPISQRLRFNDKELDESAVTINDLHVPAHATIYCEIVEENEDIMNGIEEGFGGTALVGNVVDEVPCA
jgi:hypothetical protein